MAVERKRDARTDDSYYSFSSIAENTYKETLELVGKAYSSIFEDRLCEMINQTPDVITVVCKTMDWEIQDGPYPRLIIPKRPIPTNVKSASSEKLLATLTDFVSFLEN